MSPVNSLDEVLGFINRIKNQKKEFNTISDNIPHIADYKMMADLLTLPTA